VTRPTSISGWSHSTATSSQPSAASGDITLDQPALREHLRATIIDRLAKSMLETGESLARTCLWLRRLRP
jgi:hypothetical protein